MKKFKKIKRIIVSLIIFSMMAIYGSVPGVKAASSLMNVKDTLSTSANSAVATHTINFTMATTLNNNNTIKVIFANEFSDIEQSDVVCPNSAVASVSGQEVTCTAGAGGISAGAKTILMAGDGVVNPATTTSYLIKIETYKSGILTERAQLRVAIVDQVVMTATVEAILTFVVSGTTTGVVVNGIPTSNASTATSTPFGVLTVGATSTVAQQLTVATNATKGYIVTVEQNNELKNSQNDTINSFNNAYDGTGSTTPTAWIEPASILDQKHTYGHMGLTTNDADLAISDGYSDFTSSKFAGLNGTSTMVIMAHSGSVAGPSDGLTQNIGKAMVLYMVQISALQEAGDYTNTLTYICTPTY